MLRLDEKKYKHHSILFSICGINFSNIFAAPSTEGLCLDKKKGKACFNFFFHLWDNFFNSFTAPSAEGLYLDEKKKKYKHDSIIFAICGITFSKILAAASV
jgi:hypothetical protein